MFKRPAVVEDLLTLVLEARCQMAYLPPRPSTAPGLTCRGASEHAAEEEDENDAQENATRRGRDSGASEHAAEEEEELTEDQLLAVRILEQSNAARIESQNSPWRTEHAAQEEEWLTDLIEQVIDATYLPLTHAHLARGSVMSPCKKPRTGGVWPTTLEAISRSVAAYNRVASASEHDARDEIVASICGYARTLSLRTYRHDQFINLLHQWIVNRSANVALKRTLDGAFTEGTLWQRFSLEERARAVEVLEISLETVRTSGDRLRSRMDSLRTQ